ADSGVTLIPGQEVTTDLGHANVWGSKEWIDFRRPASQWMKQAEKAGALFSVNHPLAGDCAWRHQLTTQPSIAEIWHWSWCDRTRRGWWCTRTGRGGSRSRRGSRACTGWRRGGTRWWHCAREGRDGAGELRDLLRAESVRQCGGVRADRGGVRV